jgi:hypothetical protein
LAGDAVYESDDAEFWAEERMLAEMMDRLEASINGRPPCSQPRTLVALFTVDRLSTLEAKRRTRHFGKVVDPLLSIARRLDQPWKRLVEFALRELKRTVRCLDPE